MGKLIADAGVVSGKRHGKQRLIIVVVLLILLITIGISAYAYLNSSKPGMGDDPVVSREEGSAAATKAIADAIAKSDAGDVDGALAILDQAIGTSSKTVDKTDLLVQKANLLANNGRAKDGAVAAQNAINLDPSNPSLYETLGTIYELDDRTGDAVATYELGIKNVADGPRKQAQIDELTGFLKRAQNNG